MPRFYFDIRQGERFFPDREGLNLPDLASAESEAASAAAAIGSDLLPSGAAEQVTVELRGESGQPLAAVTVSMSLTRFPPEGRIGAPDARTPLYAEQ